MACNKNEWHPVHWINYWISTVAKIPSTELVVVSSSHPGQTRSISSHRHNVVVIQARLDPFIPIDITITMACNKNEWHPVHWIKYCVSTIAKIPSTEQDGGINVVIHHG
jgi:cobalamin biosynthesis protein CobD/CbiB